LIFVLLLVVAGVGARVALAYWEMRRGGGELADAEAQLRAHDATKAAEAVRRADQRFVRAHQFSGALGMAWVGAVPLLGSPAHALADAARAGREVAAAGLLLAREAQVVEDAAKSIDASHNVAPVHNALVGAGESLVQAHAQLRSAEQSLQGPAGAFAPPISQPARKLQRTIAGFRHQISGATRGIELVRELTDASTRTRLLVLSQDTFELRPTGGFVGSYGILRIEGGRLTLDDYDNVASLPPPNPPLDAPIELARAIDHPFDISEVNWWPDFPYSARLAADMYKRQGGGDVDGVVAITENLLARLIGIFGQVEVPGYAPVVEKGLGKRIVYEVEEKQPPDVPRKKFLTLLAHTVLERALRPAGNQTFAVANAFSDAAGAGDVQAWFADPNRQSKLTGSAWSGALPRTSGDFVMMVEANMTASKANADLRRSATYEVHKRRGRLVARLDVRYRNTAARSRTNPYYNGFLRVYVPKGARPVDEEVVRDRGVAPDAPYEVFSVPVYAPAGGTDHVVIEYRLPSRLSTSHHRLLWVRQAGTPHDTLVVNAGGHKTKADPRQRELRINVST
jgi:hypothetical protein